MSWLAILGIILIGFVLGLGFALALKWMRREGTALRKENIEAIIELAKEKLGSERELSAKELENKKGLIDQQLDYLARGGGQLSLQPDPVSGWLLGYRYLY